MDTHVIFTCVALLISLLCLIIAGKRKKKRRRSRSMPPPSPPSLPILGGHLHYLKSPLQQSLARLSAKHGPLLLLRCGTRNVLVVSSAALAEECFTTNDITFANRPKMPSSRFVTYNYTTIGTANYGPGWREMRRIAAVDVLSAHRLTSFAGIRAEEARDLARSLFRGTASGEFVRVELRPRLFALAMNVVMRMMFAKRYYGEENGDEEARKFREVVMELLSLTFSPKVGDFLPAAVGWLATRGVTRKAIRLNSLRDELLQDIVEERRRAAAEEPGSSAESKKTMIDTLLELQKKAPEQYSDTFIKSLASGLISAGTDTTSNTIEWAMSLLVNNPDKLAIAREEIDEKVAHDRLVEESDLANLPYLTCIINETLRMYPAVPLLLPHESAKECQVGGCDIPRGTMLLVNVYGIQRDGSVWAEPGEFRPERFSGEQAEKGRMLVFGTGRRRCPGEGLATRQMGLVLGTLIQCFEWEKIGARDIDMAEGSGLLMDKHTPLEAMCSPRQAMVNVLSQL